MDPAAGGVHPVPYVLIFSSVLLLDVAEPLCL